MTRATGKPGHPTDGDTSGPMKRVAFRIDAETEHALEVLEAQLDKSIRGRRSVLLRMLVMAAFEKLSDDVGQ
jgi:hypothetical protein